MAIGLKDISVHLQPGKYVFDRHKRKNYRRSSSSSSLCSNQGDGPLVDPFRSLTSRSLQWASLVPSVFWGIVYFINLGYLLRGIQFRGVSIYGSRASDYNTRVPYFFTLRILLFSHIKQIIIFTVLRYRYSPCHSLHLF